MGTGLLLLFPLFVTLFLTDIVIENIGIPASEFLLTFFNASFSQSILWQICFGVVSVACFMIVITFCGWISKRYFAKYLLDVFETGVGRVPFVKGIYGLVKQMIATFQSSGQSSFQQVVMIEFPKKGIYTLGFIACDKLGELGEKGVDQPVGVFVPMTPNPTTGFWMMVSRSNIHVLEMSPRDAMKKILSMGISD